MLRLRNYSGDQTDPELSAHLEPPLCQCCQEPTRGRCIPCSCKCDMVRDQRDVMVDVGDPHKVKIGGVLVIRPNCCHSSISGERVIWHQPARPLCGNVPA